MDDHGFRPCVYRERCVPLGDSIQSKPCPVSRAFSHQIGSVVVWGQKRAPSSTRNFKRTKAFVWRFTLALAGRFALVIPMLIMKLVPTTLTVGLTTTLFVLAVAVLSFYSKSDVLSLTAAYTAVLMVFVGNSTTQCGFDNGAVAIVMVLVCGAISVAIGSNVACFWLGSSLSLIERC